MMRKHYQNGLLTLAVAALILGIAGLGTPSAYADALTGSPVASGTPHFRQLGIGAGTVTGLVSSTLSPDGLSKGASSPSDPITDVLALHATPEPTSALLFGSALIGLAMLLYRRRTEKAHAG